MLLNMTYKLPVSGKSVTLKDGKYENGQGADYIFASVSQAMAFGDLNGDGLQDAAVVLAENTGGSGVFESLVVVLGSSSGLVQGPSILLGDRVQLLGMTAFKAQIALDMVVAGPNDPLCCPSQPSQRVYTLTSGGLLLTNLASTTPTKQQRAIQIANPKPLDTASAQVAISGSISIAPFENTLEYKVLDATGKELKTGTFTLKEVPAGSAASFDTTVEMGTLTSGEHVWLQVLDVSAADGSIIALDAVELVAK